MRLNPHYPTWYLVESAWACRQLLQTTEALQVLETLRQRDPTFPSLYSPVVTCYLIQWSFQLSSDSRSLEQAFAAAQHGVSIDPVKAWNHRTLGVVYMWQKQYEQAIAEQEQAVALDPTHGLSYVFL